MHPTIQALAARTAAVLFASSTLAFAQWIQRFPATSPSPRFNAAMNFDATLGKILLFGGMSSSGLVGDTWTYDGTTWTQILPTNAPPARQGASMVYDAARGVSVLFGGFDGISWLIGPFSDTWEFDGTTWQQATPLASPAGRFEHGACYDSVRSRVVVYGGLTAVFGPVFSTETWEYDGTTWTQIPTVSNPGPLSGSAMCFHEGIGKVVLHGGYTGTPGTFGSTWLYDGATAIWSQVPQIGTWPPGAQDRGLVYDTVRNHCVLEVGSAWSWTFDGTRWTEQQQLVLPPPFRAAASLAFLPTTGQVVKFGGTATQPFTGVFDETWEFGSGVLGSGCPGTNGVPQLRSSNAPRLGQSYTAWVWNLNPALPFAFLVFGFTQLPGIDLSFLPMPGCLTYTTPDIVLGILGTGAAASWNWPSVSGTVGDALYCQAVCLDLGINGFGYTISNAIYFSIGN